MSVTIDELEMRIEPPMVNEGTSASGGEESRSSASGSEGELRPKLFLIKERSGRLYAD